MFSDFSRYVDVLIKHKITPNQFFLLYAVATDNRGAVSEYVRAGVQFNKREIEDLENRGYIDYLIKRKPEDVIHLDKIMVTSKFSNELLADSEEWATKVWEAYPDYMYIKGIPYLARNIPIEDLIEILAKKTNNLLKENKAILEAIEYGKQNMMLNMTMKKFFETGAWKVLLKHKQDNDNSGGYGLQRGR